MSPPPPGVGWPWLDHQAYTRSACSNLRVVSDVYMLNINDRVKLRTTIRVQYSTSRRWVFYNYNLQFTIYVGGSRPNHVHQGGQHAGVRSARLANVTRVLVSVILVPKRVRFARPRSNGGGGGGMMGGHTYNTAKNNWHTFFMLPARFLFVAGWPRLVRCRGRLFSCSGPTATECRCVRRTSAGWATVPWHSLNSSVAGRGWRGRGRRGITLRPGVLRRLIGNEHWERGRR